MYRISSITLLFSCIISTDAFAGDARDFNIICQGSRTQKYDAFSPGLQQLHAMTGKLSKETLDVKDMRFYLKIGIGILKDTDSNMFDNGLNKELLEISTDYLVLQGDHPNDGSSISYVVSRNTGKFGPGGINSSGQVFFNINNSVDTYSESGFKLSWVFDVDCEKNNVGF
jgi:hypothetical protein